MKPPPTPFMCPDAGSALRGAVPFAFLTAQMHIIVFVVEWGLTTFLLTSKMRINFNTS